MTLKEEACHRADVKTNSMKRLYDIINFSFGLKVGGCSGAGRILSQSK